MKAIRTLRQRGRRLTRARQLLEEAASAIDEELYAAGPDECRVHPTLRSKGRLLTRIRNFLKASEDT